MVDDKRQKVDWRSLLVGVVLGSVITVGASWITPLDLNKAKNSVIDTVKYFLTLESGFGETQVITTSTKKDDQTTIIKQTHPRKTLWDWLELGGTLAIPLVIAILGLCFQQRENKRAEEQDNRERELAQDNLSEEAIQAYLKTMADILLNRKLTGHYGMHVARAQTTTILKRLENDNKCQARIINFLYNTKLYKTIFQGAHISGIDLSHARLRRVNLQHAKLREANFQYAYLRRANLQHAHLEKANLRCANLKFANLQEADLRFANLQRANLEDAEKLTSEQIKSACFWDKAIYKGEWGWDKQTSTWLPRNKQAEQNNKKFIEELKKDKSSDPEEPPVCSWWEK